MTLADSSPLGRQATQALWEISNRYCEQEGGSHGPDHNERVYFMVLALGRKMGARLDILAAAALLHDIGRGKETASKGRVCHARVGAEMAQAILAGLDFAAADIGAICHCIRAHRFRGQEAPRSLEAKILYDADKLDSIGAIGIGRAFLFAGKIGAKLHDAEIDHAHTQAYSIEDTAYREFQVKMSRVRHQILTPEARKIADKRHAFMEIFFDELNREMYGTDIDS